MNCTGPLSGTWAYHPRPEFSSTGGQFRNQPPGTPAFAAMSSQTDTFVLCLGNGRKTAESDRCRGSGATSVKDNTTQGRDQRAVDGIRSS